MIYSRPVDKPVGEVHRGSRSDPLCVSVSALFDPTVVDLGGELQHISSPLLRVLVQLNLFDGEDDGRSSREEGTG